MEMEDYGAVLADTLGGGKPSNSPRVKYGTVTKVSGSTLDVSLAGGTITGVCMTVSCAGAKVGDRVVLLVDGALVTCLGIVATADNARYVKLGENGSTTADNALAAVGAASESDFNALKESLGDLGNFVKRFATYDKENLTIDFKDASVAHRIALVFADLNGSANLFIVNGRAGQPSKIAGSSTINATWSNAKVSLRLQKWSFGIILAVTDHSWSVF